MRFSKKLLLTQIAALAASSAAFADRNVTEYIASGNSTLAPMVSNGVNGFGVNNELFLLSQKQNGDLKDGAVYVNGKLNVAANWYSISPKNQPQDPTTGSNASTVLNPGIDLTITATQEWFTGFIELSTNAGSNSFISWDESDNNTVNPYTGLSIFSLKYDSNNNGLVSPNQTGIGLNQAYIMVGDLNKAPIYFLAGRKYVDFGSFSNANQDQTWQPLTNYFNQNIQNQLALGFYKNGVHGAVTLFKSPWTTSDLSSSSYNNNQLSTFVATASYGTSLKNIGLHAGLSYTSNLNPNYWVYGNNNPPNTIGTQAQNRVSGGIIFAEISFNPITITGNYASAMKTVATTQGKPSSWDVGIKYQFNLMNHKNWLSGNYSILDPKVSGTSIKASKTSQWLFGWNVEISKDINAVLQYGHQKVEGINGNSNLNYNFIALGASFYF